jgi:hypothetical protein
MRNIPSTPRHASWFLWNWQVAPGRREPGCIKQVSKISAHRMLDILTSLCLCASLAQVGEESSLLQIGSGSDGSRVCGEVSYIGSRAKAAPISPIMETSEKAIRQVATNEKP